MLGKSSDILQMETDAFVARMPGPIETEVYDDVEACTEAAGP